MSKPIDPEELTKIGSRYAEKIDHFNLQYCSNCFVKIKDQNGESLPSEENHKCVSNLSNVIGQEFWTTIRKYIPSSHKDFLIWAMNEAVTGIVTAYLQRRTYTLPKQKTDSVPEST